MIRPADLVASSLLRWGHLKLHPTKCSLCAAGRFMEDPYDWWQLSDQSNVQHSQTNRPKWLTNVGTQERTHVMMLSQYILKPPNNLWRFGGFKSKRTRENVFCSIIKHHNKEWGFVWYVLVWIAKLKISRPIKILNTSLDKVCRINRKRSPFPLTDHVYTWCVSKGVIVESEGHVGREGQNSCVCGIA